MYSSSAHKAIELLEANELKTYVDTIIAYLKAPRSQSALEKRHRELLQDLPRDAVSSGDELHKKLSDKAEHESKRIIDFLSQHTD